MASYCPKFNCFIMQEIPSKTFAMLVKYVQRSDEELVSILLFVSGQMTRVGPHEMQQAVRRMRSAYARIELRAEI